MSAPVNIQPIRTGASAFDRFQTQVLGALNQLLQRQILLNQTFTKVGSGTTFQVSAGPFIGIMVWYEGGLIDPSGYTTDGKSGTVTFAAAVPVTSAGLAAVVLT